MNIPGNPLAWLILIVAVVVTLYLKGYIRPVSSKNGRVNPNPDVGLPESTEAGLHYLALLRHEAEEAARLAILAQVSKAATEKMQGPLSAAGTSSSPAAP